MLKEKLSYSFANKLLTKLPEQVLYDLSHPFVPTPVMDDGSRIEYCVANGIESLVVLDHATRSASFKKERDEILQNEVDDLIELHLKKIDDDGNFVDHTQEDIRAVVKEHSVLNNHKYLICLNAQYQQCKNVCDNLSYQIVKIFEKAEKQVHFEFDDFDVPVHGYLDFVTDDCVYELKFTDPTPKKFANQIINMGWDIQAFLYHKYAEKMGKQFKWIAIGQDAPCPQRIYSLPDMRFIESGEAKFLEAEQLFIQFNKEYPIQRELYLDAPQWMS